MIMDGIYFPDRAYFNFKIVKGKNTKTLEQRSTSLGLRTGTGSWVIWVICYWAAPKNNNNLWSETKWCFFFFFKYLTLFFTSVYGSLLMHI